MLWYRCGQGAWSAQFTEEVLGGERMWYEWEVIVGMEMQKEVWTTKVKRVLNTRFRDLGVSWGELRVGEVTAGGFQVWQ